MTKASEKQVGGDYYKGFTVQPMEMAEKLGLPPTIYSALKYIVRAPYKGQYIVTGKLFFNEICYFLVM